METTRETTRDTKKKTKKETKRETVIFTQTNCRIELKVLKNTWFGSAWATDRFDIKTLWAEMGDKKGNEKRDEQIYENETKRETTWDTKMETKRNTNKHDIVLLKIVYHNYYSGRCWRLAALTAKLCETKR